MAPCERVLAMEGAFGFRSVHRERVPSHLPALVPRAVGDPGMGVVGALEVRGAEILQPKFPSVCSGRGSDCEVQGEDFG